MPTSACTFLILRERILRERILRELILREHILQALDPTQMAFVRTIAQLNIGLAIQHANDLFYGTHLTMGSFPEQQVMVDPSARVPTQFGER